MEAIANFFVSTGFYQFFQGDNWKSAIMLVIAVVLLFLGIVKKFEPLLLVPIAFGMLVTNLPGAEMFHEILFAGGHPLGPVRRAAHHGTVPLGNAGKRRICRYAPALRRLPDDGGAEYVRPRCAR